MQDRARVRIEGNGSGRCTSHLCSLDDRLHDPLVPEMQPVKHPKRQHGWLGDICVVGAVKDLHR